MSCAHAKLPGDSSSQVFLTRLATVVALFPVRHLLFKNVRGVALLVAVLAAIPATALHFAQGINLMAATTAMSAVLSLFGSPPLSSPRPCDTLLAPFYILLIF